MPGFLSTRVNITPPNATGWQTVDLSSYVPSGANGVFMLVRVYSNTPRLIGARHPSSSSNLTFYLCGSGSALYGISSIFSAINESRQVQLYRNNTSVTYYLTGWTYPSEATFLSSPANLSVSGTGYKTLDISPYINEGESALAAIVMHGCRTDPGSTLQLDLRMKGSTDSFSQPARNSAATIVGIDSNNQFEAYIANASYQEIWLFGYMKPGSGIFFTNSIDLKTLFTITSSTYSNVFPDPTNAGAIIKFAYSVAVNCDARANGDTVGLQSNPGGYSNGWFVAGVDNSGLSQVYTSNTSAYVNCTGLLLPYYPSEPTEEVVVVDTDGTGDYTSLITWEPGEQKNLVSADKRHTVICKCTSGSSDNIGTNILNVGGWTTDARHYIRIEVDSAYIHTGKWLDNKFRVIGTTGYVTISQAFTRVTGLQINSQVDAFILASATAMNDIKIADRIIVKGPAEDQTTNRAGIYTLHNNSSFFNKMIVTNSIAYNFYKPSNPGDTNKRAFQNYKSVAGGWGCGVWLNCLATTSGQLFCSISDNSPKCIAINCVGFDCNSSYVYNGTFVAQQSSHNVSDTDSIVGLNSLTNVEPTFVDKVNNDFHLDSSDTIARDTGRDLSAYFLWSFSNDIDGQSRSGSWDRGPDEYVSAGYSYDGSLVDGLVSSDIGNGLAGKLASVLDSMATEDGRSGSLRATGVHQESLGLGESLHSPLMLYGSTVEGAIFTEEITTRKEVFCTSSDSITFEGINTNNLICQSNLTDLVSHQDVWSQNWKTSGILEDSVSMSDSFNNSLVTSTSLYDNVSLSEASNVYRATIGQYSEAFNWSDTYNSNSKISSRLLDQLRSLDLLSSSGGTFQHSAIDSLEFLDIKRAQAILTTIVSEQVNFLELANGLKKYISSVLDEVTIGEIYNVLIAYLGSLVDFIDLEDLRQSLGRLQGSTLVNVNITGPPNSSVIFTSVRQDSFLLVSIPSSLVPSERFMAYLRGAMLTVAQMVGFLSTEPLLTIGMTNVQSLFYPVARTQVVSALGGDIKTIPALTGDLQIKKGGIY